MLVEAAQHYARKPCVSYALKQNLSRVAAPVSALAVNCMQRLHKRYWFLVCKGKMRQKAIVAVARELVGFIWALMHEPAEAAAAA